MKKEYIIVGGVVIGVVVVTGVGVIVYNQHKINQEAKKYENTKLLRKATDVAKINLFVVEQMLNGMSSEEAVDTLESEFGKALNDMGYSISDLRMAVTRYDSLNKRGLKVMKKTLIETVFNDLHHYIVFKDCPPHLVTFQLSGTLNVK